MRRQPVKRFEQRREVFQLTFNRAALVAVGRKDWGDVQAGSRETERRLLQESQQATAAARSTVEQQRCTGARACRDAAGRASRFAEVG